MGIFSDGQFDVKSRWYIFNPKKRSFEKGNIVQPNTIHLHYGISEMDKVSFDSNHFTLTLFENGEDMKSSIMGSVEGEIYRKGLNKDYYSKVNYMRRKATEIVERKKQEMIDARTTIG